MQSSEKLIKINKNNKSQIIKQLNTKANLLFLFLSTINNNYRYTIYNFR